ncbi:MAG: TonB family protein, partial [Rikenellaceae bacterium]|nr:TonB family protein [Rikenellaceae bacterium]
MELKKTPKADLENKRGIFLEIGLIAALLMSVGMFSWSQPEVGVEKMDVQQAVVEEDVMEITREEVKPPEPPKQQIQMMSDIINVVKNETKIETQFDFSQDIGENVEIVFKPIAKQEDTVEETQVFLNVEQMPQFQGGDVLKFRAWVSERLKYPVIAAENGIQGRVMVTFVVEKDGSVSGIQVLTAPDRTLGEEAVRVIST